MSDARPPQQRRVLLEAFKFLEPRDLLSTDQVSRYWQSLSRDNEVWRPHLQSLPDRFPQSLRELCREQLLKPCFLAHIDQTDMTIYDLKAFTRREVVISGFQPTEFAAWVSLPSRVLYCGGVSRSRAFVSDCYLIDIHTGIAQKQQEMTCKRGAGGLVYVAGQVYIFGGDAEVGKERVYSYIPHCEKFTLGTQRWSPLSDMQASRRSCNPAVLRSRVYVAGGCAEKLIEVFNLRSDSFQTALSLRVTCLQAISLPLADSLVVVANVLASQYDTSTGRVLRKSPVWMKHFYSPGGVVGYKGALYFKVCYEQEIWKLDQSLAISSVEFGT